MDFVNACKQRMDARFWLAAEERAVKSLAFPMKEN